MSLASYSISYVGCQIIENLNLTVFSYQNPTETVLVLKKGVISTENKEFTITFSLEMDELYFIRRKPEEKNNDNTMQKRIRLRKGQVLQNTGEFNTKAYIVESGLLRSYTVCTKGKEHIFSFAPERWTIADVCLPDEPCQLMIDALENSVVQVHLKEHA